MKTWARWFTGAAAAASLASAPVLAQGYNNYPGAPPPGQGTYAPQPQPVEQDELDFRGTLSPYGEWVMVPGVGEVWRPYERVVGAGFQPYGSSGHWVYTDYGWSWESDYPWGWAPFHYGRWVYRPRWGWLWRPGRTWGPAWVEWREGGGYLGWAPMAPEGVEVIEPSNRPSWCFVETSNFVSLRLPSVMLAPERARGLFGATTPIRVRRSYDVGTFYAGPPPAHVATAVGHPIRPIDMRYSPPGGAWHGHMPGHPPMAVQAPPPRGGGYAPPPPGQGMGGRYVPPPPSAPMERVPAPRPGPVMVPPPPGRGGGYDGREERREDRHEERREERHEERHEDRREDRHEDRHDDRREDRHEDRHDDHDGHRGGHDHDRGH
jgi:hypothetical protein